MCKIGQTVEFRKNSGNHKRLTGTVEAFNEYLVRCKNLDDFASTHRMCFDGTLKPNCVAISVPSQHKLPRLYAVVNDHRVMVV